MITRGDVLDALRQDPVVRNLFRRIVCERLDSRILSGHFGLGESTDDIELPDRKTTVEGFASEIVDLLVDCAPLGMEQTARRFWSAFQFQGWRLPAVPPSLDTLFGRYLLIKEDETDRVLISDLIDSSAFHLGTVADIGCGRNMLGRALLRRSDMGARAISRTIGTDINSYSVPADDPRVSFVQQTGPCLPIDDSSVDLAVLKWTLHHTALDGMDLLLREVARILRPGGRVAVVEALVGFGLDTLSLVEAEQTNHMTWPRGEWFQRRAALTRDYLHTSEAQQLQVLALEDYYGHWLEQKYHWMPLPCNYLPASKWRALFCEAGLEEDPRLTRAFGMSPIIVWGPPSIRLVFQSAGV